MFSSRACCERRSDNVDNVNITELGLTWQAEPMRGDRYRLANCIQPPALAVSLRKGLPRTAHGAPQGLSFTVPLPPPIHPQSSHRGLLTPSVTPGTSLPQGLCTACSCVWNSSPPWLAPSLPSGLCSNVTFSARAPANISEGNEEATG